MPKEIILDYDDFQVLYDHLHKQYVYYNPTEDEMIPLELIATLDYSVNYDVLWSTDLKNLFDNFCCGERINDNTITYYWFKEI